MVIWAMSSVVNKAIRSSVIGPIYWAMGGEVFDENWEAQVNSAKGIAALELYIKY